MSATLSIPVAPGELFDKISILEIKSERIEDPAKLKNVRRELALLESVRDDAGLHHPELGDLAAALKAVNEDLWDIEDAIRDEERRGEFGEQFIELARSVYRRNDVRAGLKKKINFALGSEIVEEKSYSEYDKA